MALFDEFLAEHAAQTPYQVCTVAKIKKTLEDKDIDDLDRVLADRTFTGTGIARRLNKVLGARAYGIKGTTIQRHRNHVCNCP